MKKLIAVLLSLTLAAALTACGGKTNADPQNADAAVSQTAVAGTSVPSQTEQTDNAAETAKTDASSSESGAFELSFTNKDKDGSYDASGAARILFSGSSASVTGSGVSADGTLVTITAAGTYIVSGETSDGRIHVAAGDSDDVKLVLNGLTLSSSTAAITAESADKVIVTLAEGTVNALSDAQSYTLSVGGSEVDGAVFAKTDLTINGSGALTVNGNMKHGIVAKDSLAITGGTLNVTAVNVGINGKDCVKADGASVTVNAGTDAIRSDNEEQADRGFVWIAGGVYDLTAGSDGIQAQTLLRVDGGEIGIVSGGGSANGTTGQQGREAFSNFFNQYNTADGYTESGSSKGLKSAGDIIVAGGTLELDCADDAIHADGDAHISAGIVTISSGDDGVHADNGLTIDDGLVTIEKSYEGLEAADIAVNGGTVSLTASDDGVNVSGGNDTAAGYDRFGEAVTDGALTVNGGYLYVNAFGDGLDSNGSISVTGGTVLVSGPENSGNGALDYTGTGTVSGGVLIAAGSAGMAQGLNGSGQGCIMATLNAQQGGTSVALTDENGNLIAAFIPEKSYASVVISAPGVEVGKTYNIITGCAVSGGDENGFTVSGGVSGGTVAKTVTMDSEIYSEGGQMGGFGGGMPGGMGGQMGGPGGQMPGGMGGRP